MYGAHEYVYVCMHVRMRICVLLMWVYAYVGTEEH